MPRYKRGGLFVALFESSLNRNLGFEIETVNNFRKDAFLFGEAQSRIVVSVKPEYINVLENKLSEAGIHFTCLGIVKGENLVINSKNIGSIKQFSELYNNSIESKLEL